jgi:metal-responsive CopG/Arc/MetJ family transcriptional regulator
MKILSLKLNEDILEETDRVVKSIHVSRNAYINHALNFYNQLNRRRMLKKKLALESKATARVSLEVLSEMEKMQDNLLHED